MFTIIYFDQIIMFDIIFWNYFVKFGKAIQYKHFLILIENTQCKRFSVTIYINICKFKAKINAIKDKVKISHMAIAP